MRMRMAVLVGLAGLVACEGQNGRRPGVVGDAVEDVVRSHGRARVVVTLDSTAVGAPGFDAVASRLEAAVAPGEFTPARRLREIGGLAGDVTAPGLDVLAADPSVLRIDLDLVAHASLAESAPLMGARDVQALLGFTGRGVTVAVIDTGTDVTHLDLYDRIVAEECFCTGCCPNGSSRQSGYGASQDDHGHGTNVAGIIAGAGFVAPRGIAPGANLVSMKVLAADGSGSGMDTIAALDYIISSLPQVRVVNMSLGFPVYSSTACDYDDGFDMLFARAFDTLRQRGTLVFVASGNEAHVDGIGLPACIASAISVGAVWDSDVGGVAFSDCTDYSTSADQLTCFTNRAANLDILAPGGFITAAGVGGGTSSMVGTSQATPHATGAAALLIESNPALTPDWIESGLKGSGQTVHDSRTGLNFTRIDVLGAWMIVP